MSFCISNLKVCKLFRFYWLTDQNLIGSSSFSDSVGLLINSHILCRCGVIPLHHESSKVLQGGHKDPAVLNELISNPHKLMHRNLVVSCMFMYHDYVMGKDFQICSGSTAKLTTSYSELATFCCCEITDVSEFSLNCPSLHSCLAQWFPTHDPYVSWAQQVNGASCACHFTGLAWALPWLWLAQNQGVLQQLVMVQWCHCVTTTSCSCTLI